MPGLPLVSSFLCCMLKSPTVTSRINRSHCITDGSLIGDDVHSNPSKVRDVRKVDIVKLLASD
ncbi:BgTH12-01228 [Blumeria graminis f. sp. triticale]|uniref:BgTH12-01228 n=1 Tax=Blumeria graminis f. sp. triticale TaxID=1689686 RepID=A0A9W4D7W8_BLUGR|nr:BgTH12-01228 [Blumeria graminis f. sp. triticale]